MTEDQLEHEALGWQRWVTRLSTARRWHHPDGVLRCCHA